MGLLKYWISQSISLSIIIKKLTIPNSWSKNTNIHNNIENNAWRFVITYYGLNDNLRITLSYNIRELFTWIDSIRASWIVNFSANKVGKSPKNFPDDTEFELVISTHNSSCSRFSGFSSRCLCVPFHPTYQSRRPTLFKIAFICVVIPSTCQIVLINQVGTFVI